MQKDLIVELKNVNVQQNKTNVLTNVNLSLSRGEFAYLIGKTGSGKTSLLKTLYGALPLKTGTGNVAGFDLKKLDRDSIPQLRRNLGIVFQDFNLLEDRSVLDNLTFVLKATGWKDPKKIAERATEVLNAVGLIHTLNKMPKLLSGGEQQRIVMARALLNSPSFIIADEPTGNLDPETGDEIMVLLRELALRNNTAVLFATHDYRILQNFPARIIRCANQTVLDEENFLV
ncbi:MAG: hypothetical protein RL757_1673 [Bacteroidota bacterium]|jgi:cell division transport system ATP-binding protein